MLSLQLAVRLVGWRFLLRYFLGDLLEAQAHGGHDVVAVHAQHDVALSRAGEKVHGFQQLCHFVRLAAIQIVDENQHALIDLLECGRHFLELALKLKAKAGLGAGVAQLELIGGGRH